MEERIVGAKLHLLQLEDLAGFVVANVMNSLAKYESGPMTASRLLRREPIPIDPRLVQAQRAAWEEEEDEEDALEAARSTSEALEKHGLVKRGRLSPEELAKAHAEAHVI